MIPLTERVWQTVQSGRSACSLSWLRSSEHPKAVASPRRVQVFDTRTGNPLHPRLSGRRPLRAVRPAGKGEMVCFGEDGSFRYWNPRTGKEIRRRTTTFTGFLPFDLSPDGKWLYMSANKGGDYHIWRQRFPDGEPEQMTTGPTEEQGIAMASDGKSFITSVGTQELTVWIHDQKGDHQLSSEGSAFQTSFSSDQKYLYYLKRSGTANVAELWRSEIASGQSERLLPGYGIEVSTESRNYAVWCEVLSSAIPSPPATGNSINFSPSSSVPSRATGT